MSGEEYELTALEGQVANLQAELREAKEALAKAQARERDLREVLEACKFWCMRHSPADDWPLCVDRANHVLGEKPETTLEFLAPLIERADREIVVNQHKGDWAAWNPGATELTREVSHHFWKWSRAAVDGDFELAEEFLADLLNYVRKGYEQLCKAREEA